MVRETAPLQQARLIAVTSQNYRTVTGHAGRCRRFKLFDAGTGHESGEIELPLDAVLHEVDPLPGHPLAVAATLITSGAGTGLSRRLARCGIAVHLTGTTAPAEAVREFLAGVPSAAMPSGGCDHGDHHHHGVDA